MVIDPRDAVAPRNFANVRTERCCLSSLFRRTRSMISNQVSYTYTLDRMFRSINSVPPGKEFYLSKISGTVHQRNSDDDFAEFIQGNRV